MIALLRMLSVPRVSLSCPLTSLVWVTPGPRDQIHPSHKRIYHYPAPGRARTLHIMLISPCLLPLCPFAPRPNKSNVVCEEEEEVEEVKKVKSRE